MSKLKVAAVQFRLRAEPDMNAFLAHAEAIVNDAAAAGAELVLFPELVTTGLLASYPDADALGVSDMGAAYKTVFPAVTDAFVHGMRSIAAARGIATPPTCSTPTGVPTPKTSCTSPRPNARWVPRPARTCWLHVSARSPSAFRSAPTSNFPRCRGT